MANLGYIKRHGLVDLVDPVSEQEMGIRAPAVKRGGTDIIIRIISMGWADGFALGAVAVKLFFQGMGIVFDMVEHIKAARAGFGHKAWPGKITIDQEL